MCPVSWERGGYETSYYEVRWNVMGSPVAFQHKGKPPLSVGLTAVLPALERQS